MADRQAINSEIMGFTEERIREYRDALHINGLKAHDSSTYCEANINKDTTEQEHLAMAKAFVAGWSARQKDVDEVLTFLETEIARMEKEKPFDGTGLHALKILLFRNIYYTVRSIFLRINQNDHDTDICSSLGQE